MRTPTLLLALLAFGLLHAHGPATIPHLGGAINGLAAPAMDAPDNDLCSNVVPMPLAVGGSLTFIGDNTEATFAGDAEPGTVLAQYPSPNTWHAFTTTECSKVTVSYCATVSGWTNVWKLLSVDCPADSLIQASSSDNTTCANGNWTFSFDQLAPGTYYLPVPNVGFGQGGGPYNISVVATQCSADLCSNITPVPLTIGSSLTFIGDNSNATFDGDAAPGTVLAAFPSPNTWHGFTTTACSDVTVSYCGTDAGWTNIWPLLTTTDCPADSIINASTSDQTTCANGNWTFSFSSLPAGTYHLPVPNVGFGQGGGAYSIQVSSVACAGSNDLCSEVTPEPLDVGATLTFNGNNASATFAGDAEPGTILAEYPAPNTWHAFTVSECSDVTVSYCATDSGWSNVWHLLTTDCPADSIIDAYTADTTTCSNGNWTFRFRQLQPGTYYLPVPNFGFGQGGGPYSIAVSAVACLPDHVSDINSSGDWSVFPNPTNGEVTLVAPREMGTVTVELIDMTGRTMYSTQEVFNANSAHQIPLSGMASGTYALRMTTTTGRSTQLLIVK